MGQLSRIFKSIIQEPNHTKSTISLESSSTSASSSSKKIKRSASVRSSISRLPSPPLNRQQKVWMQAFQYSCRWRLSTGEWRFEIIWCRLPTDEIICTPRAVLQVKIVHPRPCSNKDQVWRFNTHSNCQILLKPTRRLQFYKLR